MLIEQGITVLSTRNIYKEQWSGQGHHKDKLQNQQYHPSSGLGVLGFSHLSVVARSLYVEFDLQPHMQMHQNHFHSTVFSSVNQELGAIAMHSTASY